LKLQWLNRKHGYNMSRLGGDVAGGVIAALIALPYGLAMASLMGLPPALGVFTSILSAPITAVLGRNPVLIGGTASATVPFIAQAVRDQGIGGAAKVSIVAAIFMMAFCVLRLGRHISHVPQTVVTGFSCGIGAMMVLSQFDSGMGGSLAPLATGLIVIVVAFAAGHWMPQLPAPLIGIIAAAGVSRLFHFNGPEIGALSAALPPFAGFSWSARDVHQVLPSALALAFITSVNLLLTSRVVEHFRGRNRLAKRADADAELGAYGIANIVTGVFGAPLSVGIPARSLAVVRCGGSTRVSNLVHCAALILILRYGSGMVSQIPVAAMAGVTAWMGICLLDWSAWRRLPRMKRIDSVAFVFTFVAVIWTNAVLAVMLGCSFYAGQALYARYAAWGARLPGLVQVNRT
jgi:sulfate permease, SulP family